jgi:hypothetical protein
MTRTTNARIAGFTFLLYIAAGIAGMVLFGRASSGEGIAAKLASIGQHATYVRVWVVLSLLTCFAALALAVTLNRITRDEDPDLAMLALTCRAGEGVLGAIFVLATLGLLWLGTAAGANARDATAGYALGAFLFKVQGWNTMISSIFFSVGSTLFSSLFLRGRMVPVPLAWLGVVASVLLVLELPMQLIGFLGGMIGGLIWLPMLVFEVTLALWLLIKGVPTPATR